MEEIEALRRALREAEAVVIGAGAGLSASAGFTYGGERFRAHFADFEEKYGFHDMYAGGFYPYSSAEEYWAYWSRYIALNRYEAPPLPVYERLLALVKGKDYFVITTNVDHCFQRAGVEKTRLFYTQGDYGLFQCSVPCRRATYDNEEIVRRMVKEQKDKRVPAELIPRCPRCGAPMVPNLRADGAFVEDDGWEKACKRYRFFLEKHKKSRVLYLELGVGGNTPGIIKFPFWNFTAENERATYACVNRGEAFAPREISARSVVIDADIGETLRLLM